MNLVIVESPTKAKTIAKFLGKDYLVESSYGHIRDLPKSRIGIDLEKDFEPHYIIPVKAKKRVTELKKKAAKMDGVILATDLDREGEAIAWHLKEALGLESKDASKVRRIVFHEITKTAIAEALEHPRTLDLHLVDAQQARRILDRLVGYKLSPFLWKKIMSRLSAGRVQSVALRLIAEREDEIRKFKADEYWTIDATLKKDKAEFTASLAKISGESVGKLGITKKEEAEKIKRELEDAAYAIVSVDKKTTKKNSNPPFTTSTLQQEASKRLRFSARETMRHAQALYEAGLITYMRTDSVNLSQESLTAAARWIKENLGSAYEEANPRVFKTKSRLAQEAHEAIRPTDPRKTPDSLKKKEAREVKLYELIWQRFIASQLPPARFDAVRLEIQAQSSQKNSVSYTLVANGTTLAFDGYLKIWPAKFEERELPAVTVGENVDLKVVEALQHFTEPPPRYNEASLIKALEQNGIGRPSTYAPTLSVIQDRHYVEKDERRRFVPTEIGESVNKMLVEHFPEIVDIQFTAKMEEELDSVAAGKENWRKVIREFYEPFSKHLEKKFEEVEAQRPKVETTDEVCPNCGKPMVVKFGRFGKFLACSGFPECKTTKPFLAQFLIKDKDGNDMLCGDCKEGKIIRKRSRNRRFFFGCSRYPECKYASWKNPAEPVAEEVAVAAGENEGSDDTETEE